MHVSQAIKEQANDIRSANMKLFVRRGGPNYQAGLALMKQLGTDTGLPIEVHGPDASMTGICLRAIEYVQAAA